MTQIMTEDKRKHSVKCDYGMYDYYRYFIQENKNHKANRNLFGIILKEFNNYKRESLSKKGADIILPFRLGKVELRKMKPEIKLDDNGNVINHLPVNWKETRKLWREDSYTKEKKIKIRFTNEHTDGYTFKVSYLKNRAIFKNKSIYRIKFNRKLKRTLSESIFQGKIDAFINPY